jgi:hypothetical protein
MNSKSFPYQKVTRFVAFPMLPMQLQSKDQAFEEIALVDSGAEMSVLPYDMGLRLGLDWEKAQMGTGLAGRVKPEDSRFVFIDLSVESFKPFKNIFLWVKMNNMRLIVGQANFLAHFDVLLSARKQEFTLYEVEETV